MKGYHCSVKTVGRSAGRSAVAAAAYRAGERLHDERTGETHDYTRRSGVVTARIVAPSDAPYWASDRSALWNHAEFAEKRKNSTVAREFVVAIPADLDQFSRESLVHDFAAEMVEQHRFAIDYAIHLPDRDGDQRNHHAHLLLTTRVLDAEGFGKKTREFDDRKTGPALVVQWKKRWAELAARALEKAGFGLDNGHHTAERWRHGYKKNNEQLEAATARDDVAFVEAEAGRIATVHHGPVVSRILRKIDNPDDPARASDFDGFERVTNALEVREANRRIQQMKKELKAVNDAIIVEFRRHGPSETMEAIVSRQIEEDQTRQAQRDQERYEQLYGASGDNSPPPRVVELKEILDSEPPVPPSGEVVDFALAAAKRVAAIAESKARLAAYAAAAWRRKHPILSAFGLNSHREAESRRAAQAALDAQELLRQREKAHRQREAESRRRWELEIEQWKAAKAEAQRELVELRRGLDAPKAANVELDHLDIDGSLQKSGSKPKSSPEIKR